MPQIAEFRVPEFSVEVMPEQDEIVAGDDALRTLVSGSFFSGGALNNAQVSWFAEAKPRLLQLYGSRPVQLSPMWMVTYFFYG